MWKTVIKSALSNNYYTNFRMTAKDVIEYDLIDARRGQVSRHYVFKHGSKAVVSIHVTKFERTINAKNLQLDLWLHLNEMIQRARDAEARKEFMSRFEDGEEVEHLVERQHDKTLLLVMQALVFLFLFLVGITVLVSSETEGGAVVGTLVLVASAFPVLSGILINKNL